MSDRLKPGDRCWLLAISEGEEQGGYPLFSDVDWKSGIPDVPHLAQVARVLAAHPGMGAAVAAVLNYKTKASDLKAVRALAAALNGGTHDER